jgi:tetratricopeptide (TPR) repeat protein
VSSRAPQEFLVSDEEKAPKLRDWLRQQAFRRFGMWGVAVLSVLWVASQFVAHVDDVSRWLGVPSLVTYLNRDPVPQADPSRFSVAVTTLDGDSPGEACKREIVHALRDFRGIEVLGIDRELSVEGSVPEAQERAAHQQALRLMEQSHATILIWGSVLRGRDECTLDLYLSSQGDKGSVSRKYVLDSTARLSLPGAFWTDLSRVLRSVVAAQMDKLSRTGAQCAVDPLEPFIERVAKLTESGVKIEWDNDSLRSIRLMLAAALTCSGSQSGNKGRIQYAIGIYRSVLTQWPREYSILGWGGVQSDLGDALWSLGQLESTNDSLEAAVSAYREALTELTRDRLPRRWATLQDNLGTALATLGVRESDTSRLQEAVASHEEALKVRTRERSPVEWAQTQNNLCVALRGLGERQVGSMTLRKAVAACREALHELARESVPLQWAIGRDNLGAALSSLGERESDKRALEEAQRAHIDALGMLGRDEQSLAWATAQFNLGTALLRLGEVEGSQSRLQRSIEAYSAVLPEPIRSRAPAVWSAAQIQIGIVQMRLGERNNLQRAARWVPRGKADR